ncbi:MAG: hypothetical protein AAF333_11000 [Planctomycetota bacterium]
MPGSEAIKLITALCVVGLTGLLASCSHPPRTPEIVLPDGFVGVVEIRSANQTGHGPTPRRGQLVVDIPNSGIRWIDPDIYVTYFTQQNGQALGFRPRFASGQSIPFFSPVVPPDADNSQVPMFLGLTQTNGTLYCVVDSHANLTALYNQFFEDARLKGAAGWDRYLQDLSAVHSQIVAERS